ncbi:VWA domain-containing protein [Apibacter muscae]|uniref:VWA domain-containing protein n=1 Tax=Apibacter muscae TaxID=2509004 RepID=A0A563DI15_9FLAO|nr:VWA domain-containing protein [Apibacter muscae]TWP29906.1 VWA domain-containing protein [Apibacter muscae]
MGWEFEKTSYFYLLLIIPVLIGRILYLHQCKTKSINRWVEPKLRQRILGKVNLKKFIIDNVLIIFAVLSLMVGLVNVLGGIEKKEIKREGIDVVFVIDVSKSMDAQDIIPSRIEKAKKILDDILNGLDGGRVGIVIFAGHSYSVMPLSNDYAAAELYLNSVDTGLITQQGTNIADAILETSKMLSDVSNTSKAIVLVSDGEIHEGELNSSIQAAKEEKITIFSIGIGTTQGAPIPMHTTGNDLDFKKDRNGEIVLTKLDDNSLKKLASETGGAYFHGDYSSSEISKEVLKSIDSLKKKEQSSSYTYDHKQYFQIFISIALILLIIVSLTNYKNDFNI